MTWAWQENSPHSTIQEAIACSKMKRLGNRDGFTMKQMRFKLQGPSICWKSLKKCSHVMNFGKFNTNKIFNLNYYRLLLPYIPAFSGVGVATGMFKIQWSRSWVRYIEFNEIYFCGSQSFMCVIRLLTAGRGL